MADNFPQYPATSFDQAVDLTIFTSNQLGDVINGDATSVVNTESGEIPTLRKALIDNFYFKNPIQWNPGNTNTVFNQLYVYMSDDINKGWYYAPTATLANPVLMGTTPVGDANWKLYSLVTTGIPEQVFPWYTEITQTTSSIVPPYEFDTAIVTFNGSTLVPGKDYTIANNTITFTPALIPEPDAEVPDILFCYIGKVQEGDPSTNYVTYNSLASSGGATIIGTSSGQTLQNLLDNGAQSILYNRSSLGIDTKNVQGILDCSPIFCYEFIDEITNKPDTTNPETWDWTPAINAAIAASKADRFQPVVLPPHKVITTGGHVLTSQVMDTAGGSPSDGKNYKGVPLIGYGKNISKLMFKPANSNSICISLIGNSGGHDTSSYLKGFTIDAYDSTYRLNGYGIELNGVNYCYMSDITIYYLNENFRFYNGITGCWTEFNRLYNCHSYRGNICFSFVRGSGNDSFNGTSFYGCFGQIKKSGGGYGLKLTGNSSSSLVWWYGADVDITFYGGDLISDGCKVISLNYAEMTLNSGDIHCEGAVTMEALDDFSRCQHRGLWLNNGNTAFSIINERSGAQGRFTFRNLSSRTSNFTDSNISDYTPGVIPVTPDTYNNNGVGIVYMQNTNFASPMIHCQNYAGNGFYFGQIPLNGSVQDITPSWKLTNDGGIIKTYNISGMRFQVGSSETFRLTSTALYPFSDNSMTIGLSSNRISNSFVSRRMYTATVGDLFGNGSPEGSISAGVGSTYRRLDGGTSSSFYVKESGTGNTGWVAK